MSRKRRLFTSAAVVIFAVLATIGASTTHALAAVDRARDYVVAWLTKDIGAPTGGQALAPFAAGDPPMVRLAAAGDVGTGGAEEKATARTMAAAEDTRSYDALVLLGDNVYPAGDPRRLDATVFGPFAPVLDDRTRLWAILGNHDVMQRHGDAQASALGLPARWYAKHLGPVLFIALDSTEPDNADQQAWLEATLAAATEPWKIVALHHPPYSSGWHGSNGESRDAFVPIFERTGVQLVLSGHEHDYQRTEQINGVTYVVSGGAADVRPTGRADFTAVSWSTYHFLDLAVWPQRIELRAVGQDGLVYDAVTLTTAASD